MRKKREKKGNDINNEIKSVSSIYENYIINRINSRRDSIIRKFTTLGKESYIKINTDPLADSEDRDAFFKKCSEIEKRLDDYEKEFDDISNKTGSNSCESRVITNYSFLAEIIEALLNRIKESVEVIASPLSGEIFELKKGLGSFTRSFKKWKDEITDVGSTTNYNNVISSFDRQTENFSKLGKDIEVNFNDIKLSLDSVIEMFNKISDDTKKIDDIASNIKTLSINASIEAARAGVHGKGFKVIATGTKELSDQTNTLLTSIGSAVNDTRKIINNAEKNLIDESKRAVIQIEEQNSGYLVFKNVLNDFYNKFNIVFNDIVKGTEDTFRHIDKIMPTVQLHDGIEQQLGNISEIIKKERNKHHDSLKECEEQIIIGDLNELRNKLISSFETQITTDIEVEVLSYIVKKYNLEREKKIEIVNDDIEFF